MTILLDITDIKNGTSVLHKEFKDDSQFLAAGVDSNGHWSFLGNADPEQKAFIAAIRKGAQKWAREQDLDAFLEDIRTVLVKRCAETGNLEAKAYLESDSFHFDADAFASAMKSLRKELAQSFRATFGDKGGMFLFHTTYHMMMAMIARLNKEKKTPVGTVWVFPESALGKDEVESVLQWLFRRR